MAGLVFMPYGSLMARGALFFCRKGKRQAQALWADIGKVSTRYLSFTATRLVEKFQWWNF
jgi:hypothetical protein